MRTKKMNLSIKIILLSILVSIGSLSVTSCAKKVKFMNSSVVPAAQGFVKVSRDNNKNYVVKVSLYNLAEVGRLEPAKLTYVVWLVNEQGITRNVGQIKSSKGFMSKKLKASFETVSSFKPAKVFLTAEDDPSTQYPGSQVVLLTDTF